jgi:hypothetical protein
LYNTNWIKAGTWLDIKARSSESTIRGASDGTFSDIDGEFICTIHIKVLTHDTRSYRFVILKCVAKRVPLSAFFCVFGDMIIMRKANSGFSGGGLKTES